MSKTPGNSQLSPANRVASTAGSAAAAVALAPTSQLRRSFGVKDGVALIVCNVVGVGIFTTPSIIAKNVPEPGMMLALWAVGGCLALAGALSYAQLGRAGAGA